MLPRSPKVIEEDSEALASPVRSEGGDGKPTWLMSLAADDARTWREMPEPARAGVRRAVAPSCAIRLPQEGARRRPRGSRGASGKDGGEGDRRPRGVPLELPELQELNGREAPPLELRPLEPVSARSTASERSYASTHSGQSYASTGERPGAAAPGGRDGDGAARSPRFPARTAKRNRRQPDRGTRSRRGSRRSPSPGSAAPRPMTPFTGSARDPAGGAPRPPPGRRRSSGASDRSERSAVADDDDAADAARSAPRPPTRDGDRGDRASAAAGSRRPAPAPAPAPPPGVRSIRAPEVRELRAFLTGDPARLLPASWRKQGLCFVEEGAAAGYGLEQHDGGPCGVVAAVQAHVVDELYYADGGAAGAEPSPAGGAAARSRAVARAIVTIVWRAAVAAADDRGPGARGERRAPLATLCGLTKEPCAADREAALRSDGVTERLSLRYARSEGELESLVMDRSTLRLYEARHGPGAVLLLASALLSRTVAGAKSDGDDAARPLVDGRGFANFEVVNLLLFGARGRAGPKDLVRPAAVETIYE